MISARRDIFQAISDPTRRKIIQILTEKPLNLNAIAEHFEISRPAISKQVKILEECGLLEIHREGRERICSSNFKALEEAYDWIGNYRDFWMDKLDRLGALLEKENSMDKPQTLKKT